MVGTKSNLPPLLQSFKEKLLSGNDFSEYKQFYKRDYLKIYHEMELIKQFRSQY